TCRAQAVPAHGDAARRVDARGRHVHRVPARPGGPSLRQARARRVPRLPHGRVRLRRRDARRRAPRGWRAARRGPLCCEGDSRRAARMHPRGAARRGSAAWRAYAVERRARERAAVRRRARYPDRRLGTLLLAQASLPDRPRHVLRLLSVPASVLELDRGVRRLAGTRPDDLALPPARPRAEHRLVLDSLVVERLLHLPARMRSELRPGVLAAMQLHRHRSLLLALEPIIPRRFRGRMSAWPS